MKAKEITAEITKLRAKKDALCVKHGIYSLDKSIKELETLQATQKRKPYMRCAHCQKEPKLDDCTRIDEYYDNGFADHPHRQDEIAIICCKCGYNNRMLSEKSIARYSQYNNHSYFKDIINWNSGYYVNSYNFLEKDGYTEKEESFKGRPFEHFVNQ